ncbi:MAG: glycosyltransferase [Deltaproteobacteria bacterium]|nr:glycosyltransferase [Deltaproteobacteria bacterium]
MADPSKRVLLITYYYPPMQAPGAYRTAAFSKFLPRFGYHVTTLTVRINRYAWNGALTPSTAPGEDIIRTKAAHIGEIAKRLVGRKFLGYGSTKAEFRDKNAGCLKKALVFFYENLLTFPEPEWLWYPCAIKGTLRAVKEIKPDILLSCALPVSSHWIARRIKRRFHIPWVADYRDLWSQNHFKRRSSPFNALESLLERRLIRETDALTTVSQQLAVKLQNKFGKSVRVVTNGFDSDEFDAEAAPFPQGWSKAGKKAIYTGMIYPERQDPVPLFRAIQLLSEGKRIEKGDFELWLFGPNVEAASSLFPLENLKDYVIIGGNLPRNQALHCQRNADLLVIFDWTDKREKGVYTTKFFEYVGAGRPILSIGPKDTVIAETLRLKGFGVTEEDPAALAELLKRFIHGGDIGTEAMRRSVNADLLREFTREHQTGEMAAVLDLVLGIN